MSSPAISGHGSGPDSRSLDSTRSPTFSYTRKRETVVIQDAETYLPLSRLLKEGDTILLLTPAVPPRPASSSPKTSCGDPFEPLGRALAKYHPWVRHVPYLPRNGITTIHAAHIRVAAVVVFVISGPAVSGQTSQVALAETTRTACGSRPHIILACCDVRSLGPLERSFPAIVQIPDYSPSELEAAAGSLFRESQRLPPAGPNVQNLILAPKAWPVEVWDAHRDVEAIYRLWCDCVPDNYKLSRYMFQSLLQREGYDMHYVVREPRTAEIVGFCATYTNYVDSGGERLIGCMAALLVHKSYRNRGIGLSLHDYAAGQLVRTRGICRLQLGSTFPRLFYGLPLDSPAEDWFRRRNWPIHPHSSEPGTGQEACDWILKFEDWPAAPGLLPSELTFRPCELSEFPLVLEMVKRDSERKDNVGWYDQYVKLAGSLNIRDIILGLQGDRIVATAITYVKKTGSPVAEDLPWAATIGDDVGGVTCICILDDEPDIASKRDTIMIRLLDSCIRLLLEHGMRRMFIDAVKGGEEGFQSMGFRKWERYREVWRDV
ncbi:hypothetical protein V8F33_011545 [Rhypophila sp. PSN 637]